MAVTDTGFWIEFRVFSGEEDTDLEILLLAKLTNLDNLLGESTVRSETSDFRKDEWSDFSKGLSGDDMGDNDGDL